MSPPLLEPNVPAICEVFAPYATFPAFAIAAPVLDAARQKFSKRPYSPEDGRPVAVNNGDRWSPLETAVRAVVAGRPCRDHAGDEFRPAEYVGIRLAVEWDVFCVDMDRCFEDDSVTLKPWARSIVEALACTYIEISMSEKGLHILGRGKFPPGARFHRFLDGGTVEMYDERRWIVLTGVRFGSAPGVLADCGATLPRVHAEVFGGTATSASPDGGMAGVIPPDVADALELRGPITARCETDGERVALAVARGLRLAGWDAGAITALLIDTGHALGAHLFRSPGPRSSRTSDGQRAEWVRRYVIEKLSPVGEFDRSPNECEGQGGSGSQKVFARPSPAGYAETFELEPDPPPILIEGVLPCDVFGLVGPGGVSKTTLMIWLKVHVILGRPVFGRRVNQPGACLLVTAEDSVEMVRYRLRQLCDSLDLSDEDRRLVAAQFYVEDVSGKLVRLVEANRQGNLAASPHVDALVAAYRDAGIVLATFDPAVFFSPGERFVNDAEASLMQVARQIGRGLGQAAVGYVHHTGKETARKSLSDQYAGRGGSAFADNSRAVLVMHVHEREEAKYPRPIAVPAEAVADGRVFRLQVAKFSPGKRESQPIWIVRGAEDPWQFVAHECDTRTPTECAKREQAAREAEEEAKIGAMRSFVAGERAAGRFPTKTEVLASVSGNAMNKRALIERAVSRGILKYEDMPADLRRGNRRYFVDLGNTPGQLMLVTGSDGT